MDPKEDEVEILVHVSAPCTSADDVRFRRLASAYLDFAPSRVTRLGGDDDCDGNGDKPSPEEAATPELSSIHVAFSDELFSQSFDHGSFVRVSPKQHAVQDLGSSMDGSVIPSSQPLSNQDIIEEIPDSYPACSVAVDAFCSPTRILEHYLHQIKPTARPPKRPLDKDREGRNSSPRRRKNISKSQSQQNPRPPTTPLRRHQSDQGAFRSKDPLLARSMSDSHLKLVDPSKARREIGPDALEILPPEPEITAETVTEASLLTSRLENLAAYLELERRYRPESPVGVSHCPFERGYWLLDCSSWDTETRWQVWVFVAHWIRSGFAGWGVSCHRDDSLTWIRTYCWGRVAGHIYLLLYLASVRRLKYMDISWIGDDGKPKIVVAARGRKSDDEGMSLG